MMADMAFPQPSLLDRLRGAGRLLKAALSRDVSRTNLIEIIDQILPRTTVPKRGTMAWLRFVKENPLLRMAVYRIAEAMASPRWRVMAPARQGAVKEVQRLAWDSDLMVRAAGAAELTAEGELVEVTDHPLTGMMERNLGWLLPGMTLRKLTYAHTELVGDAFWLLGRNGAGVPVESLLIPPSWVLETPRHGSADFRLGRRMLHKRIPEEDVLWFRDQDPEDRLG